MVRLGPDSGTRRRRAAAPALNDCILRSPRYRPQAFAKASARRQVAPLRGVPKGDVLAQRPTIPPSARAQPSHGPRLKAGVTVRDVARTVH